MSQSSMFLLAQQSGDGGGAMVAAAVFLVLYLGIIILTIAGVWATFAKAGKPGWACLIPIYNAIVLLEVAGKPIWWIVLLLIPLVNMIIAIMVLASLAGNFGKGVGFTLGLLFLPFIFYPLLGFGDARYRRVRTEMV